MSDFINRVRNVATGRPASIGQGSVEAGEPQVPPLNFEVSAPATIASPTASASSPDADLLGIGPAVRMMAEMVAHSGTSAPLTLGILGQAGAGKSFALKRLLDDIASFASGASRQPGSPFIAQIAVARVDAAAAGEPATLIAASLFDTLQKPGPDGRTYPALAEEASDAVTDPVEAARMVRERLANARRRLDTEREALQEMNGRRTRLADSVLYEASGSRIDAHARVNRASIESRLRGFGFLSGDPVATYKDLVRDVAENGGVTGRIRASLRALWGFRGQTRLIVLAIFFFAAAWGIGEAQATRETWLGWMRSYEALKPAVTWIEAHISWLATARQAATWAGVLALAWNVLRALRFILPIFRGVSLFKADVETRNNDLDILIANQTRRVDDLASEIDPLTKRAADADRRASAISGNQNPAAKSPFADGAPHQATAFINALAKAVKSNSANAPRRVVVAFDNLDALSANAAANFMAHAQELLAHPAYVTILTASGDSLTRFIDVPLRLDSLADNQRLGSLARIMLGGKVPALPALPPADATSSMFGLPLQTTETDLLETLAPLAARTPRDVKRFVNVYKLLRGGTDQRASLACALAIQSGATESERAALEQALDGARDGENIALAGNERLSRALDAASASQGSTVTAGQMRQARALAAQWSF